MTVLDFTFVHQVQVRTKLGDGSYGPSYAASTPVSGYLQDVTETVRNEAGDEVTSTAKFNADLAAAPTVPPTTGQFSYLSEVTLPSGRVTRVISVARHDSGALALGLDHVQVHFE